jgi:uncharacterized protein with GYD domain
LLLAQPLLPKGGTDMPTYVILSNLTQQGIQNIKDGPNRLDAAKKAFKAAGGELKEFYLTMGEFDLVVIAEAPNDETAATLALAIGAQGNIRTRSMRAFNETEYRKLIANLP